MAKRTIEQLNLLDNFLFGKMMSDPKIGEEFSRILVRIILGRDYEHLKVVPQKIFYGADTILHGARLDVYIEQDEITEVNAENTVIDIEPEQKSDTESIQSIPKRVRFYHSKIDQGCLNSGENYNQLKCVYVIMIMPFDPFDRNRMIYTIKNSCIEEPDMEYEDGARTMFLYTHGEKTEGVSEGLKQLLTFMEKTQRENAVNEDLKTIQNMVEEIKKNQEVSIEYMKIHEREEMLQRIARSEGEHDLTNIVIRMSEGATKEQLIDEGVDKETIALAMQIIDKISLSLRK